MRLALALMLVATSSAAQSQPNTTASTPADSSASESPVSRVLEGYDFEGEYAIYSPTRLSLSSTLDEGLQVWPWASVTKQVLAVAVMQQVEFGEIALDEPADTYLPALAGARPAPTVRQLLRHQSGLRNPDDTPRDGNGIPEFYTSGPTGLGWCTDDRGPARTEGWRYNNCDYIVLGALLEAVTGQPIAEVLDENIFEIADLSTTRLIDEGSQGGFVGADEGLLERAKRYGASAGLVGTLEDMTAFNASLLDGTLLSEEMLDEMWKGDPDLGYMALGQWSFSAPLSGCSTPVSIIERRGAIANVRVQNYMIPESRQSLSIVTPKADFDFGEIWTGEGVGYDMLSAWLCTDEG